MSDPVPVRKASQVEVYVGEVLPEDSPVLRALPAGIDPRRFKNSLQIAVMMNPALLKVDPRLTFREVARIANHGLSLDPSMGEAWLIVRRNGKTQRDEPQAQLGYRGKMKLARQSGEVARIAAYPVSQKCMAEGRFKVSLQEIKYEPDPFDDDSPAVGYFAYVLYKDGTEDYETMSVREIHKIRERSDGYRAFKKGSIKSTPWSEYEGEMSKKVVLSRLLKRVPMSADLVEFLRKDEAEDYTEVEEEELPPERRQRSSVARLREIAAPARATRGPKKPATPEDEPGTEDEPEIDPIDIPEDAPENIEPLPGSDEPIVVDTTSPDYARGMRDFHAGLKKCVKREILDDPKRMTNWQAGFADAREEGDAEVEEAMNGRENT
jgi:recombination protein RecT